MKNKIPIIAALLLLVSLKSTAQSVNDYRSVADGNWTTLSVWEVFDGASWIAATTYPGQVAGTNDVTIEGDNIVVLSSNILSSFNSLTVGDNTGGFDRLEINNNSSLLVNALTVTGTGQIEWTRNTRTTLSLPLGVIFVTENGGALVTDNPCNSNKRLAIGSAVYASCNGGGNGIDYDFNDINVGGGTLQVIPSSNSPICSGEIVNLMANAAGRKLPPSTYSFSWFGTGPGGYTFSSSDENPIITAILSTGTYTYEVTITDDQSTNYIFTNDTQVVINVAPSPPLSGGDQTACSGSATATILTASAGLGETIDWYSAATGGTLLLSGNASYAVTVGGSYFAETRDTTSGCVSTSRTEVVLTISSCRVITNRRITYRVKKS